MAVRGRKCQDIKHVDWISSSFSDSFGCSEDLNDVPAEKKVKLNSSDFYDDVLKINVGNCVESALKSDVGRVWTDKYVPKKLDDLIVHKKKVAEVCDCLKDVTNGNKFNRILLITGPTGSGKTCTLNVLCRDLNVSILEWVTPIDNSSNIANEFEYSSFDTQIESNKYFGRSKKTTVQLFSEFILQAAKYSSLLSSDSQSNRKVVLVKDLPDVFIEHPEIFHEIIKRYYNIDSSASNLSPIVFIISDTNIIRDLFPDDLKSELNIRCINFNPVTQTNIVKALDRILLLESSRTSSKLKKPNNEELVGIAESSDGDLRSAILKLQFVLSYRSGKTDFKIPKPVPNPRSERIRVIKSGSSKLKNGKHKICEIDKDKTVDFFNSVGRVLYPKKEFLDDCDHSNYRFVHSPSTIADVYTTEPNKFINILHENYLDKFTDIKDVCVAANSLSVSDLLASHWEAKDIMVVYSLNTATRSLMVSNTKPAPNTFRPISKSKIWITENKKKANRDLVRQIFPDIQCEKDVLLDVLPYLNKLKVGLNLTKDEDSVISKISKYN